jgi:hypothetical protein
LISDRLTLMGGSIISKLYLLIVTIWLAS